jgi:hypothetical protein
MQIMGVFVLSLCKQLEHIYFCMIHVEFMQQTMQSFVWKSSIVWNSSRIGTLQELELFKNNSRIMLISSLILS